MTSGSSHPWRATLLGVTVALAVGSAGYGVRAQDRPSRSAIGSAPEPRLTATAHPLLPGHPSLYWLVPEPSLASSNSAARAGDSPEAAFARGARLVAAGEFAEGLPLVSVDLDGTPLADYAEYYTGIALLGLGRAQEADQALSVAAKRKPEGYLREAVPLRLSDVALARSDPKRAADLLEDLGDKTLTAPEEILLRLGRAAETSGDVDKALRAYRRVYYEFPLSTPAVDAQNAMERLETPSLVPPDRFKLELKRAERLFTARRWAQARAGFAPLARVATDDDKDLIALRLGECDFYLDRARAAREAIAPYVRKSSHEQEARYFYLSATRAMGERETYISLARQMVADFPNSPWTEETLNNLASSYVSADKDEEADGVYRDLVRLFPESRYAERAAWKIGWADYRKGDFAEAARTFELEAVAIPRADMRPAWLYWAGRARDQMGDTATANARYRLEVIDYQNTYYGRLASKLLAERHEPPVDVSVRSSEPSQRTTLIPSDVLIRQLISLELYDDALKEVQYAQRIWGDSPPLQATAAWIRYQTGLRQSATDRFQNLRGAITMMKRAYPQYLAAGGEGLPPEVLRVMFPLDYWPLIKKYSDSYSLDPYLMSALVAQESTFTAEIRSSASAVGLMQIIAPTGRRYARILGITPFSVTSLTKPELNVQIGMTYFKDLIARFGSAHYALASYGIL